MSDPEPAKPRTEQVNIRLTPTDYDIVQALVFLEDGKTSAAEVLRSIVHGYLAQQARDEDVGAALELLTRRRARKAGKLASLDRRARRPKGSA
jgi:hypothetical protein